MVAEGCTVVSRRLPYRCGGWGGCKVMPRGVSYNTGSLSEVGRLRGIRAASGITIIAVLLPSSVGSPRHNHQAATIISIPSTTTIISNTFTTNTTSIPFMAVHPVLVTCYCTDVGWPESTTSWETGSVKLRTMNKFIF